MRQKGFATILGLCLILVVALVVRGIEETERNHTYETTDAGAEFELQNAADGALVAAAGKVISGEVELPRNEEQIRINGQHEFPVKKINSKKFGEITVRTWGERVEIHQYRVEYNAEDEDTGTKTNVAKKSTYNKKLIPPAQSYLFFSVATADSPHTGGKIYRRAFAYVTEKNIADGKPTIYFMEFPQSDYKFAE